jgi:hypothetical protein
MWSALRAVARGAHRNLFRFPNLRGSIDRRWLTCLTVVLGIAAPGSAFGVDYGSQKSVPMEAVLMGEPVAELELRWAARADVSSYSLTRVNPDGGQEAAVALGANADRYLESGLAVGGVYEWRLVASLTAGGMAYGVLRGGIDVALVEDRGRALVCVADAAAAALGTELERLRLDLLGDGWRPELLIVDAAVDVPGLKATIVSAHAADPLSAVFLFGDLPVPYSGSVYPDGHTSHRGAWPADVYYAEIDGNWTDAWRISTGASSSRNHNVVGDGKFDQSSLPSDADLMLGRVDLSAMPAFAPLGEMDLLRRYLDKDHAFRSGGSAVPRKALVDDHLSGYTEGFSANTRSGFSACLGSDAVVDGDWPDEAGSANYLLGAGYGTGNYTSVNGVGSTASFAAGDPGVVFSLMFGSYFGDWDTSDNFLRAPLACDGVALASGYCGRPQWQLHGLGLGEPLGAIARQSQNARSLTPYLTSYYSRYIHVALHGDPTIRLFPRPPATALQVVRGGAGVEVTWGSPSGDGELLGFHVYRSDDSSSPVERLNASLVAGEAFTDAAPPTEGCLYQVRAIYRETTGAGSFINNAQSAFASLPTLPSLAVGPAVMTLEEGGGSVSVVISRSGDVALPLEVALDYSGTASADDDVSGASARVTIPAGVAEIQFELLAVPDGVAEGTEELVLALASQPESYVAVEGEESSCLTIIDTAYGNFAQAWFGHQASDPEIAAGDADPDGDGIANLIEFAAGSSPVGAGLSSLQAFLGSNWMGSRIGATSSSGRLPRPVSICSSSSLRISISGCRWRSATSR